MKRLLPVLVALPISLLITACNFEEPGVEVTSQNKEAPPRTTPDAPGSIASGPVTETMDTGGYTYVQVDTGSEKIWAAAPECVVQVGDEVVIPEGMPMRDYHSNTLDRDFELVYFVGALHNSAGTPLASKGGESAAHGSLGSGHGSLGAAHGSPGAGQFSATPKSPPVEVDVSGVEKAEDGLLVSEIFAQKADLSGQPVTVRGKVVKFNQQIMGKNWLHIRDGSGEAEAGTNDVTITSNATAQVGDTVLVTGQVALDKDFGYGYRYDVIIEDAQVVVE